MASPRTRRLLQELKPNNENDVSICSTHSSTFHLTVKDKRKKIYFSDVLNVHLQILNGFL